jgi:hypothetical protein
MGDFNNVGPCLGISPNTWDSWKIWTWRGQWGMGHGPKYRHNHSGVQSHTTIARIITYIFFFTKKKKKKQIKG